MKVEYDNTTDSLYIRLHDARVAVHNELFEGADFDVILDVDESGKLAGIEIPAASRCVNLSELLPIETRIPPGE